MNLENTTAILKFGADWCGPCQQMEPVVEDIEEDHEVIHIDIEENQEVANEFHVRSLPTFLALDDGEVIDQHSGVASYEQLETLAP